MERVKGNDKPAAGKTETPPPADEKKDLLKEDWGKLVGTWATAFRRSDDGNEEE